MTRYTVVWVQSAQDELADLWLNAPDRNAVTTAAHAIDQELGEEFSPAVQTFQSLQEHAAEFRSQCVGIDKPRAARVAGFRASAAAANPATLCGERRAAAGDQGMYMNVGIELLIPGVQHHGSRRFELLLVFDHLFQ